MAHESFENEKIADVMNRLFVNIKVDREERPEIDQIYMAALTAMGEHGGWPLTMFLTPDGRPFWGGTYFPPEPRYGRPGFVQVLNSVSDTYAAKKSAVADSADSLFDHVNGRLSPNAAETEPALAFLDDLAASIYRIVDTVDGGISGQQKFPSAPFMEALWISSLGSGNLEHQNAFINSLRQMLLGGIYDHIGGGLCRYATDPEWLVPHFEKMLYDNAALIRHCIWAHSRTNDDLFRKRIESAVQWLNREMVLPESAFAASLDADSEGEEGKYYVWSKSEIEEILGQNADDFCTAYGATANGNWEGQNILHLRHGNCPQNLDEDRYSNARYRLLNARQKRVSPGRDNKIIVDWNAMMIRALCEAGRYFAEPGWIELGRNAFRFIASTERNGRLPHTITSGVRRYPGLLGDHAAMILAAIALYEATGADEYLQKASTWFETIERWHGDGEGAHYLTAYDANDVPMRTRGDIDDAVASAASMTIEAVHRLALATGRADLHDRAFKIAALALGRAQSMPYGQAGIVTASSLTVQPLKLVISMAGSQPLVSQANRIPDPRRMDIPAAAALAGAIRGNALVLPDGTSISPDKPGAYLCAGPVCYPPITDPKELQTKLLDPFR